MGDLGFKLFYEKGLHATAALDSISTPLPSTPLGHRRRSGIGINANNRNRNKYSKRNKLVPTIHDDHCTQRVIHHSTILHGYGHPPSVLRLRLSTGLENGGREVLNRRHRRKQNGTPDTMSADLLDLKRDINKR